MPLRRQRRAWQIFIAFVCLGFACSLLAGLALAQATPEMFAPLAQWKAAILANDSAAVKSLYSVSPAAVVFANGVKSDAAADENFWIEQKPQEMQITMIGSQVRHGLQQVIFSVELKRADGRALKVTEQQSWQKQGDDAGANAAPGNDSHSNDSQIDKWRIVGVIRTDAPVLKQPATMNRDLYPALADTNADLQAAEKRAAAEHKRVLLVFGANWCFDCHVLDLAFQRPDMAAVLASSYEVVHVDLGPDSKKNADLVAQYQIPLNKGVPALAIVEPDGALVVSNKNGEFQDVRGMTPEAVLAFLNEWKPEKR